MPLIALLAIALSDPAALAEPHVERLENALTVVVVEDHTLPLVSIQTWFSVGSSFDSVAQPGLCRIVETLFARRNGGAAAVRALGGAFAHETDADFVSFRSVAPPWATADLIELEVKRLQPTAIESDEARRAFGDAIAACADIDDRERLVGRLLFPDAAYQHPAGIVAESLRNAPLDALQEFAARWFCPGNATLFVIGDIDPQQTLAMVRKHFGAIPWREPPRQPDFAPPKDDGRPKSAPQHDEGPTPVLEIIWRTPPAGFFENAATDVLMEYLCNPIDGVLENALQSQHCTWRATRYRRTGVVRLAVWNDAADAEPFSSEQCDALAQNVTRVLTQVVDQPPEEVPFYRARALRRVEHLAACDSFDSRATAMARGFLQARSVWDELYNAARADNLSMASMQDAAQRLLKTTPVIIRTARHEDTAALVPPALANVDVTPTTDLNEMMLLARNVDQPPAVSLANVPTPETVEADGVSLTVRHLSSPLVHVAIDGAAPSDENTAAAGKRRDLLTYRALTIADRGGARVASGPTEELAPLLEVLLSTPPKQRPTHVAIVGDVTLDAAREALTAAIAANRLAPAATTPKQTQRLAPGFIREELAGGDDESVITIEVACPAALRQPAAALAAGRLLFGFGPRRLSAAEGVISAEWRGRGAGVVSEALTASQRMVARQYGELLSHDALALCARLGRDAAWRELDGGAAIALALWRQQELWPDIAATNVDAVQHVFDQLEPESLSVRCRCSGDASDADLEALEALVNKLRPAKNSRTTDGDAR